MKWVGVILALTLVVAVNSASNSTNPQVQNIISNASNSTQVRRIIQQFGGDGQNGEIIRRIIQQAMGDGQNAEIARQLIQQAGGGGQITIEQLPGGGTGTTINTEQQGGAGTGPGTGITVNTEQQGGDVEGNTGGGGRRRRRILRIRQRIREQNGGDGGLRRRIRRINGGGGGIEVDGRGGGNIEVGGGLKGGTNLQITNSDLQDFQKKLIRLNKKRGNIRCREKGVTHVADKLNIGLQNVVNKVANGFGANDPDPGLIGRVFGGAQTALDEAIGGLDQAVSDFFCGFNRVFNKIGDDLYEGDIIRAALEGGEVFVTGAGSFFGNLGTNAIGAVQDGVSDIVYGRRSRDPNPIVHRYHGDLTDVL